MGDILETKQEERLEKEHTVYLVYGGNEEGISDAEQSLVLGLVDEARV